MKFDTSQVCYCDKLLNYDRPHLLGGFFICKI